MIKIKSVLLKRDYPQKGLNTNQNGYYLTSPKINMRNQIKPGFSILKEDDPNSPLPDNIHQILLGSLLGDMYCRKEYVNSNIEEIHSIAQKEYLTWKHSFLKDHFDVFLSTFNNPICKAKGKTYIRKSAIRLRSKVSEKLNLYHNLFYKNGKKTINKEILDQLDTLGLAVWYCDDGYYDPVNNAIRLHTEGFSIEENILIKEWFFTKWGINANIKKIPAKDKVLLRFSVKDSDKFLNLVKEHIFSMPPSIWYKLGEYCNDNVEIINRAKLIKSERMKIYQSKEETKIRSRQQAKKQYYKHRAKMLERAKKNYILRKDAIKAYHQKPEVIIRRRERDKLYRLKYKVKRSLYQKEYWSRPEVRIKIKEYNRRAKEKRTKGDQN